MKFQLTGPVLVKIFNSQGLKEEVSQTNVGNNQDPEFSISLDRLTASASDDQDEGLIRFQVTFPAGIKSID